MKQHIYAALGALLIGLSALPTNAAPQTPCGPHGDVAKHLGSGFSENPVSMGLASNGTVIEVFASSSGTFTILMTRPDGITCLMAAGENWEELPKRITGAKI